MNIQSDESISSKNDKEENLNMELDIFGEFFEFRKNACHQIYPLEIKRGHLFRTFESKRKLKNQSKDKDSFSSWSVFDFKSSVPFRLFCSQFHQNISAKDTENYFRGEDIKRIFFLQQVDSKSTIDLSKILSEGSIRLLLQKQKDSLNRNKLELKKCFSSEYEIEKTEELGNYIKILHNSLRMSTNKISKMTKTSIHYVKKYVKSNFELKSTFKKD